MPIDQFSRRSVSGYEIRHRTVAVLGELDRFGYIPSKDALLVEIDEGDCDPPLTRDEMLAVHSASSAERSSNFMASYNICRKSSYDV